MPAMLASCSIPFMLEGVAHIPGAQPGAHWDGGLVDYHVHWPYASMNPGLVLYPHFQRQVVPGWLDKGLKWRHRATPWLSNMVLLCPNPEWVRTLPGGKLPDRTDFKGLAPTERMKVWTEAVARAREKIRENISEGRSELTEAEIDEGMKRLGRACAELDRAREAAVVLQRDRLQDVGVGEPRG